MELHNHVIDQVIAWSGKFGLGGSITAIGSGATGVVTNAVAENPAIAEAVINWSFVIGCGGFAVGFMSYLTQAHFAKKKDQRDQAEEERRQVIHEMQKRILDEKLDIKFTKDGMIE